MKEAMHIERSPWFTQEAGTPPIPPGQPGIDFVLQPAVRQDRFTIALLGSCCLPKRQAQLYGPACLRLMQIVAIDHLTGAVSCVPASEPEAPPLPELRQIEPPPTAPGYAELAGLEFWFNCDLTHHLSLPPSGGRYTVFVWLEDLVSPARTVTVDQEKTRLGQPGKLPVPSLVSAINVRTTPASPPRVDAAISLVQRAPEQDQGLAHLYGSAGRGVMPIVPPGLKGHPQYLTVLAQLGLKHTLAVHNILLPEFNSETGGCDFDFELSALFDDPPKPQRTFVVAVIGSVLTKPLTAEPPGA